MKDRDSILSEAARLKISLLSRAKRMLAMGEIINKYDAGLTDDIKIQRYETMLSEYANLKARQDDERKAYATLRWALGITPEIDTSRLELER